MTFDDTAVDGPMPCRTCGQLVGPQMRRCHNCGHDKAASTLAEGMCTACMTEKGRRDNPAREVQGPPPAPVRLIPWEDVPKWPERVVIHHCAECGEPIPEGEYDTTFCPSCKEKGASLWK